LWARAYSQALGVSVSSPAEGTTPSRAGRVVSAVAALLVALLCAGLCAWLALAHPLSPTLALALSGALAMAVLVQPVTWPFLLLALLPVLGLMPWTGWITAEEFDLAVLAVAAGGFARLAWGLPQVAQPPTLDATALPAPSVPNVAGLVRAFLWLLPLLGSTWVSMQIGVAAAGGLEWGWWQGYREPLNSLRLTKPIFEVLLLLPLWRAVSLADDVRAQRMLGWGMLGLLALTALVVVMERVAFVGLLNFSSDYRATGPYWEMHVGGAALDAALSASLPFAVAAFFSARSPLRRVALGALVVLGVYAVLVTFSRIVLAAVPLGVLVWWWLQSRQSAQAVQAKQATAWTGGSPLAALAPVGPLAPAGAARANLGLQGPGQGGVVQAVFGLLVFAGLAWWCFPTSGYRGLLAFVAAVAVLLPLADLLRRLSPQAWVLGLGLGVLGSGGVALATLFLPRGAYLGFGAAWLATAALVFHSDKAAWLVWLNALSQPALAGAGPAATAGSPVGTAGASTAPRGAWAPLALAAYVTSLSAFIAIAWHWGGLPAVPAVVVTVLLLFLLACLAAAVGATRREPLWPSQQRWQVQMVAAMLLVSAVMAVFVGGGYMRQRVTEVSRDGGGRQEHWTQSLAMLNGADWLFGQGLGRFAANRALSGRVADQTGDYRLLGSAPGAQFLALSSGKHALGPGEFLRVSQRIALPARGPLRLQLDLRSSAAVQLAAEVCEKHLLYAGNCANVQQDIKPLVAEASSLAPIALPAGAVPVAGAMPAAAPASAAAAGADKQGRWQRVQLQLADTAGAHDMQAGAWWAPRQIVFSVALSEPGQRAELDNLVLTDAAGVSLLSNGDFEKGLAHWFFSSDKNHLPWHAKNLQLHLLMEQGLVGLLAFSLAALVGLWRLSFGGARAHPLAPLLAASLVAVLVVGAIDSLLDMPRIGFLLLLLMALALALPSPSDSQPKVRRSRRGRGSGRRRRSSSSGSSSGTGSGRSSSGSSSHSSSRSSTRFSSSSPRTGGGQHERESERGRTDAAPRDQREVQHEVQRELQREAPRQGPASGAKT
jgi:hypothetical protein